MFALRNPLLILYMAVALLISLSVHEASHAFVADQLGDPTARRLGRITLNPIAHLDPMGAFVLVISSLAGFGIGWGKPVPVNPNYLRRGPLATLANGPLIGMAIVALAGPVSNLLMAILGAQILRSGILSSQFFGTFVLVNVLLAVFNMIPIPPLDGYRVLVGILPTKPAYQLARLEPYGFPILILLVFLNNSVPVLSFILQTFGGPLLRFVTQGVA